ncbi:hypothetical protein D3C87_1069990 [compost metagenome]
MKRLTVLLISALSMLASSSSLAGYINTNIVMGKTGESLRVAGGAYHSSAGFSVSSPSLTNGSYLFTIDANSDERALVYLGNLLCRDFGKEVSQNLRLDPSAMIYQGKAAVGAAGQVLLKKFGNGFIAVLVPMNTEQVVEFVCN